MRFLRSTVTACWLLALVVSHAQDTINLATLNTYWFFNGAEGKTEADKPRDSLEYSTKAGHLIGLLPAKAPLFVGFQELGGG
jgi:hypothetical protein